VNLNSVGQTQLSFWSHLIRGPDREPWSAEARNILWGRICHYGGKDLTKGESTGLADPFTNFPPVRPEGQAFSNVGRSHNQNVMRHALSLQSIVLEGLWST
jgi:hypothetical protein